MTVHALSLTPKSRRPRSIRNRGQALLAAIASECSDTSYYCTLSVRALALLCGDSPYSCGRDALKRLVERGLVEGHWSTGWRLTTRGWEVQRGAR